MGNVDYYVYKRIHCMLCIDLEEQKQVLSYDIMADIY